MFAFFSNPHLRHQLLLRSVEGVLVLVVASAAVFAFRFVQEARLTALGQEAALAAQPQFFLSLSALQSELRLRGHDLTRIRYFIAAAKDIVSFIEVLEV